MKCPVCHVPGFVVEYQEIELDCCAECGGIWFDGGELELVLGHDHSVDLPAAETSEAKRPCPICRKKMAKVNIGPNRRVMVDSCSQGCGVWFDSGELGDLTRDLEEDGWHVAPEVRQYLCSLFSNPDGE